MSIVCGLFRPSGSKQIACSNYAQPLTRSENDVRRYPEWLRDILEYNAKYPTAYHPAVEELENLLNSDLRLRFLASGMFDELADQHAEKPYSPSLNVLRSYDEMLKIFDHMIRVPPLWDTHLLSLGLEAAPFFTLLCHPMHTTCGFAFFQDPAVCTILKRILDTWSKFLASPASASCLNDSPTGWFCSESYVQLVKEADIYGERLSFEQTYICDPTKPNHGYRSWDDFFTRRFRPGVRPVAAQGDDSIIANVCESKPWRISCDVLYTDKFWTKSGSHSLKDMLACDELSHQFVGGTIYQAYLSALSYHRWHSPVTGSVVRVLKVPGKYFSEPLWGGFGGWKSNVPDEDVNFAQAYLSATATRAIVFIQADNLDIGLMAVVLIGMFEISTCELTVTVGQKITKGQEIGMFHYGGSTHCVLFRSGVEVLDLPDPKTATKNVGVRSQLGRVVRKQQSQQLVDFVEKNNP